jgi:hypothetical protein
MLRAKKQRPDTPGTSVAFRKQAFAEHIHAEGKSERQQDHEGEADVVCYPIPEWSRAREFQERVHYESKEQEKRLQLVPVRK